MKHLFQLLFFVAIVFCPLLLQGEPVDTVPPFSNTFDILHSYQKARDSELRSVTGKTSAALEAELKTLHQQNAWLAAEKQQLEQEQEQLVVKIDQLQAETAEFQEQLVRHATTIQNLQQQLAAEKLSHSRQVEQLGTDKTEQSLQTEQLNRKLQNLQQLEKDKDQLLNQLAAANIETASLLAQLDQREQEQHRAEQQQAAAEPIKLLATTDLRLPQLADSPLASVQDPAAELEEISAMVQNWSKAWSSQAVEDYLSFYAADFTPATKQSRQHWEQQRRSRLQRPEFIQVSLADIQIAPLEPGAARVSFSQSYRSNSYADRVNKQLLLQKQAGRWKIVKEVVVKN